MDESETYANMRLPRTDPQARSRAEPDVSYVELNVTALSAPRVRGDGGGLGSTYTEVNVPNDEPVIDVNEAPPIAAGPSELPTNAQAAAHEQESNVKIGNKPCSLICLLCLVTFALIVIVAGLSIHGTHINLRHQITEMETKYKSVNETKAQICELLTSRREQTCSENWVRNKDRCYYVSTFQTSFYKAMYECSNRYSRLLQIKSSDEVSFVSQNLVHRNLAYWIGKCKNGNVGLGLLYKVSSGTSDCGYCNPNGGRYHCGRDQRFICEKSAPFAEKIQGLCQQPVEAT